MLLYKKLTLSIILSCTCVLIGQEESEQTGQSSSIEHVISDVALITDGVAEMIVECKTEKDPQKITVIIVKLITAITNIVRMILEKRRAKRGYRSFIDDQTIDQEIEDIVHQILKKAGIQYDDQKNIC